MYIPTRDRSLGAAWIALDDAYIENGCLWVLPVRTPFALRLPHACWLARSDIPS